MSSCAEPGWEPVPALQPPPQEQNVMVQSELSETFAPASLASINSLKSAVDNILAACMCKKMRNYGLTFNETI